MGSLSLAARDIYRHKPQSMLFISIQSVITTSGMVFCGLATNFQNQIRGTESLELNQVISQIFNEFLTFMISFSLIAGILTASILSALITVSRMEDLATLLSLGGTFKKIQRVPLAQVFFITLISGIIGWCGSIIGLIAMSIFLGLERLPINFLQNIIFSIVYIIFQVLGTYFVAGFIINYLLRKKFREIIDSQFTIAPVNHDQIWGISTKGKISFLIAYLISRRSRVLSLIVVVCISVLIFLPTYGALGGDIIRNTTNSYIERGYGTNNYVITTASFSSAISELYNPYGDIKLDHPFLSDEYSIPSSFIALISNYSTFEARLLLAGKVKAITSIKVYNGSLVSPGNRTIETFFWGIDNNFSLFDYYHFGQISLRNSKFVHIGDGIQQSFLHGQILESIMLYNENNGLKKFEVEGVIVDPFARGNCIYIDLNELVKLKRIDPKYRNVIFIKNPTDQVFDLVHQFSLSIFSLDDFKQKYIMKSNSFWIATTFTSTPVIFSAGLSLVAYSGLVVRIILHKDLKIIRILGGKRNTILRIIVWINLLSLRATPLSVFLGYFFAYSTLIEDPVVPSLEVWAFIIFEFAFIGIMIYLYIRRLTRSITFYDSYY